MSNDRRSFIKQAALYSGALLYTGCKTVGRGSNDSDSILNSSPIDPSIPKRVSWSALPDADKKAFIEAVSAMKSKMIPVPASFGGENKARELDRWAAQAECHQWYCSHHTRDFLPWHRSYLYYFEQYLRKEIRDSFRLPYWDWTVDTAYPIEVDDKDFVKKLGITRDGRDIAIEGTPGSEQTKQWWQNALKTIAAQPDFDTIGGDAESSGLIEAPYHNMVHVAVGGNMGFVPFAGKDPVFWLHHCNVDRLWSMWMDKVISSGKTRLLFPSTDVQGWLGTAFPQNFWGADDKLASATIRSSLFTEELGYNYDTMEKTWAVSDIPKDLPSVEVEAVVQKAETPAAGLQLAGATGSVLRIQFTVPPVPTQKIISLRLKVYGIPVPPKGGYSYGLSLVLEGRTLTLPSIAFFSGSHEDHDGNRSVGISLTDHLPTLLPFVESGNKPAYLVLTLRDKKGKAVAIKSVMPDFAPDASKYRLKLKAVFG